jgi:hypothetical protein
MNVNIANTSTPVWFQLRINVSKNILDSMTEDEKKDIEDKVECMQKDGLPKEVQQQYVAEIGQPCPAAPDVITITDKHNY